MRFRFHCTDGRALVIDRRGRALRRDGDVTRQAEAVARRLMAEVLIEADWSRWMVCVQDERGAQIEVVPFPPLARAPSDTLPSLAAIPAASCAVH